MPKLVRLTAKGTGTFRSALRSDTLWGAICWNMRMLREASGEDQGGLPSLMDDYKGEQEQAFYISSAFPWVEKDGIKTHYLPAPVQPAAMAAQIDGSEVADKKKAMRQQKQATKKSKGFISWQEFASKYGGTQQAAHTVARPKLQSRAVTHNQIDRRRLGTFTTDTSGLLFHMNENYLGVDKEVDSYGFYFLLDGKTEQAEAALRLLETMGIAGDKSIGKGHFKIDIEDDAFNLKDEQFSLPKIEAANAQMSLSLYNPVEKNKQDVLSKYIAKAKDNDKLLQYRLEDRVGRNVYQGTVYQDRRLLFKEGSVFPLLEGQPQYPGEIWQAGEHAMGHDIYRYGHAFMLNMKI